jgi:dienelactone hydrolase
MPPSANAAPLLNHHDNEHHHHHASSSQLPRHCPADHSHPPLPVDIDGCDAEASKLKGRFVWVGSARGTALESDIECYVSWPREGAPPTCVALVVTDIFGLRSGRHAQICDALAEEGFVAVCPDLMGDGQARARAGLLPRWPIKSLSNILDLVLCCKFRWLLRALPLAQPDDELVLPRVQAALDFVQREHLERSERCASPQLLPVPLSASTGGSAAASTSPQQPAPQQPAPQQPDPADQQPALPASASASASAAASSSTSASASASAAASASASASASSSAPPLSVTGPASPLPASPAAGASLSPDSVSPLSSCAVVGFCWGAAITARILAWDSPPIPVVGGVGFHPSLHPNAAGRALVGSVTKPFVLAPAGNDPPALHPGGEFAEAIRAKFGDEVGGLPLLAPFPSMLHGWMTRGPLDDPAIAAAYQDGLALTTRFFRAVSGTPPAHHLRPPESRA